MDTLLKGYHLPKEIMELIIGHLDKDNDIKNCRLVCSNWNFNVYSICFKRGIQVALGSASRCEKLMKDLVEFPQMAAKIRKLCLSYIDEDPIDPDMFVSVLDQCTYIEKLRFRINLTGEQYLLALFDKTPHISRIKEITVDNVLYCSRSIQISHLLINFVYRDSITLLEICDVRNETIIENSVSGPMYIRSAYTKNPRLAATLHSLNEACETLLDVASKFFNLKVLKLQLSSLSNNIDITAIMATNIRKLEILHIFGSHCRMVIQDPPNWPNFNLCNPITELDIRVYRICVSTLECIMTKFSNLEKLVIKIPEHLTDYENSSFDIDESHLLMNQFTSYCSTIKDVEVYMVYETFTEDLDFFPRQLVSQDGQLFDMVHNISSCCYHFNAHLNMSALSINDYDLADQNLYIHGDGDVE
ncbi:uncharacterized protein EV154DRAFT_570158 [Mucor mucedo]|uniref:uncharacterized protein n=1 Tax=Mucor mucedo TaxID=29922 RepID=UPI002220B71E|nr:uncharacterized protein EV154DRAFT_570158 [Mucor mucedo]KAI7873340.1 hypothetical protein EV154DRAFT_570158 [Mucor mucedo]